MMIFLRNFFVLKVFLYFCRLTYCREDSVGANLTECVSMRITQETQFKQLENCEMIDGSLWFKGFTYSKVSFPNLLVIKGSLMIHKIDNLTSVRQLLPNLAHIQGNESTLSIVANRDLEKLDFQRLLKIDSGLVETYNNPHLCLSDMMIWSKIQKNISPIIKNVEISRRDCPSCPPNKLFYESKCVETCPKNTLNLMNVQCISKESCEQENSKYWKKLKFLPVNGSCRLIKYCDSIKISKKKDISEYLKAECQVVQGFVDFQFKSEYCDDKSELPTAMRFLNEIEEIRDYLRLANFPRKTKHVRMMPKLKVFTDFNTKHRINIKVFQKANCSDNNCYFSNLTLGITPKTYGFAVKILNEEFKNLLKENVTLTSYLLTTDEYYGRGICKISSVPTQQFMQEVYGEELNIYNLDADTSYYFALHAFDPSVSPKVFDSGDLLVQTLPAFVQNISFSSEPGFLTIKWRNVIYDGYARPMRYEFRAFHVPFNETDLFKVNVHGLSGSRSIDLLEQLTTSFNITNFPKLMTNNTKALFIDELMNKSPERKSSDLEYMYAETVPKSDEFKFRNVLNFAYYYVTIRACYGSYANPDCSNPTLILTRTSADEYADQVENIKIKSVGSHFELTWDLPKNPNGQILYFIVRNKESSEPERCITYQEYMKNDGKIIINDSLTDSITVSMKSVGSNWDLRPVEVTTKPKRQTRQDLRTILLLLIVFVTVIVITVAHLFWQERKMHQLQLKINPNYPLSVRPYEPDNYEVARASLELSNEIGKGSFGKVFEGILRTADDNIQSVAVKTIEESASHKESLNFLTETSIMKNCNTIHIVKLLGIVSRTQPYLAIMELMVNGDLKTFLSKNRPVGGVFTKSENYTRCKLLHIIPPVSHMAIQIADGMAYMGHNKFVHRDLAARNCMVAADYTVKIGDFGLARNIYKSDYYQSGKDTVMPVRWMAPEFLKKGKFSSKSDVFSYGIVLWEIVTHGKQPYKALSNKQVINFVVEGGIQKKPKEECPANIYELMRKCWKFNPKDRISFIEIIETLIDEAPASFREHSFYCLKD